MIKYKNLITNKSKKKTNGEEFCYNIADIEKINSLNVEVHYCNCDYCNIEIIAIWDNINFKNYSPYLGIQSKRESSYKYSEFIQIIKEYYKINSLNWKENNLLNSHARAHSDSNDLEMRMSNESVRLLCNDCFQKTYNRIKVKSDNDIIYSLSVIKDMEETIESVMKDLNIKGEIIGKGGIIDYK